jgi:hypothetical protein
MITANEPEVWKEVPSEPSIMASSKGRVWIKPFVGQMPNGTLRTYKTKPTYGFEEKTATAREGSPKRMIFRVGRLKKTFKVHRLVCEAFWGPAPSPSSIVLHLDEDPSNNVPSNLRWGTRKENQNFPKAKQAFSARVGDKSPWAIHMRRSAA